MLLRGKGSASAATFCRTTLDIRLSGLVSASCSRQAGPAPGFASPTLSSRSTQISITPEAGAQKRVHPPILSGSGVRSLSPGGRGTGRGGAEPRSSPVEPPSVRCYLSASGLCRASSRERKRLSSNLLPDYPRHPPFRLSLGVLLSAGRSGSRFCFADPFKPLNANLHHA